ncbi:putative DNA repair protein MutK [Oxalobacteraceae bacterium GrIS 1.11]
MAGSSLLALLDDIAGILDDVALMSKVAAKKTAGVLGDDLALNAQQVSGVQAERELPVVWAVGVGSLKNKAILVPSALAVSALLPWAITPLLMLGGVYLCYEGCEKIVHGLQHPPANDAPAALPPAVDGDVLAQERDKIQGAIRTDFILSAEIIVIALGTVAGAPFGQQVAVVAGIAIVMTVGVYGLVAAIVKLDDAGLYLSRRAGPGAARALQRACGRLLLAAAPRLMQTLSLVGTLAMFMVGGGILSHGWPAVHALIEDAARAAGTLAVFGPALQAALPSVLDALAGLAAGALALAAAGAAGAIRKLLKRK